MTIYDAETQRQLDHQCRRREEALAQIPPDRVEAAACLDRIDDILDRRPKPIAVAPDGETILDDQSAWVAAQTGWLLPGRTTAVNTTGEPEIILTEEES